MYVEAAQVVAEPDGTFTFDGRPVNREWGAMGKSLKNFIAPDELCEAVRRRHVPAAPDGHGAARRVAPVGDRATSSACTGSCSGCGAT